MTAPACSDQDFIRGWNELGPEKLHKQLGCGLRAVFARRVNLEKKYGIQITGPEHHSQTRFDIKYPDRLTEAVQNGIVLVASDAHYWPGQRSAAHRGFVRFCADMQPRLVIMNGDVMDCGSISRHPPHGWENKPTVQQEIECAQERLGEIEAASGKAKRYWVEGNHEVRFSARLATNAPEFAKVHGFRVEDHFPLWRPAKSLWINQDVVVKHRYRSGVHATHNNTVNSGKNMVTGDLHSAKVTPWTDYNGTRWGIDVGCIADPWWPQFHYMDDNTRNWRSAFAVLTFHKGRLLQPELALAFSDNEIEFRGQVLRV